MRIFFVRRKQFGVCIFFSLLLCIFYLFVWHLHKRIVLPPQVVIEKQDVNRVFLSWQNTSQKCKIPKLDMYNPEILQFQKFPDPLKCEEKYGRDWLELDSNGSLLLTKYAKKTYGSSITCDIHYIFRTNDFENSYKIIENYQIGTRVNETDFFYAKCKSGFFQQWTKFFMQIVPIKKFKEKIENEPKLDVYFLGIDSLSQMSFRRQLPKTVKYLEDVMGSVILNGYNIVGDGTPQAFIPILTGKTEPELPTTRKRDKNSSFVDVYPFVWNNFSKNGYITLYGEDVAFIGTFSYRLKGFQQQPTDHYTRTMFVEAENELSEKIVTCLGEESIHKQWFRYGEEFMTKYPKSTPKFALLHHAALTHDNENNAQLLDNDLMHHLKRLFEGGYFENALVIVMADHGCRFNELRNTQQGQLEERLPFFSIFLPEKFRNSPTRSLAYKNLQLNANRLTSPFDIYATLQDILIRPDESALSSVILPLKRSMSLFRPIPDDRSCEQAGIAPHWCTCLDWQSTIENPREREFSMLMAQSIVKAINDMTEPERNLCAPLKLLKLENSRSFSPDAGVLKYSGVKDDDGFVPEFDEYKTFPSGIYQLTFTTTPGNAKYAITVKYDSVSNKVFLDLSAVSHVNKYGDNPHCILNKNSFLILYCVCYDKI